MTNALRKIYFTSESVTKGHPDKICDQISDSVLDECLSKDPDSRVACETFVTTGQVIVGGEIRTNTYVDIQKVVRSTIRSIGYTDAELLFTDSCGVLNCIHEQSTDIAMGVDTGGAGDQGMMFGGAVKETPELMPLPIALSRAITNRLTYLREIGTLYWAKPDGKAQVTVEYMGDEPVRVDTVVVSIQHSHSVTQEEIYKDVKDLVIGPVLSKYGYDIDFVSTIHINPTGSFVIGGPHGDSGLTGRKIIVDTYGGYFSHGGGCFSGKDPSKVDRSGAYMARYLAKNIVASGLADKCEVQLSYAIGIKEPTSIHIDTFYGYQGIEEGMLERLIRRLVDLTPEGIINRFSLRNPSFKYRDLASGGHIGREDLDLPWERTDLAEGLSMLLNEPEVVSSPEVI